MTLFNFVLGIVAFVVITVGVLGTLWVGWALIQVASAIFHALLRSVQPQPEKDE